MPTFEIPDGPTTVKVSGDVADPKSPRTGNVVFTVTNKSDEIRAGRMSVQVTGKTKADWFTIDGEKERDFAAGESQTAAIKINVPPDVEAGDYAFRLRVVAVNDPDNDHADGPVTTAQVAGAIKPPPPKTWLYILIAVLVLAAVGVGLYVLLSGDDEPANNTVENNTVVETTDAEVPNLIGKTLAAANAEAQGFELVPVAGTPAKNPPDTIIDQSPKSPQRLTKGLPIKVTFDPGVAVPPLSGNTDAAVRALSKVGLHVATSTSRCEATGNVGDIVDQNPKAGVKVASDSGVDIFVRSRGTLTSRSLRLPCNSKIRGTFNSSVFTSVSKFQPAGGN